MPLFSSFERGSFFISGKFLPTAKKEDGSLFILAVFVLLLKKNNRNPSLISSP
jgi:hypothetical protein